jgi:ELP3 family radical SAM enzyme/protein acetyltransferase
MKDIEDFIKVKSALGKNNYNNVDTNKYDLKKCKKIFNNLLLWLQENESLNTKDNSNFNKLFETKLNKEIRQSKIQDLKKSVLLNIFNNLLTKDDFEFNLHKYFDNFKLLLRKRPMRNISGITSVTIILHPFPDGQKFSCKHDCFYCPNEPAHEGNNWQAQPRSYLYWEPAVQRANRWEFNPIKQMFDRLDGYFANGHTIDKLELIIEGGTFTEFPVLYLERFMRDLIYAANIYLEVRKLYSNYDNFEIGDLDLDLLKHIRKPGTIEEEIIINKTSKIHIIGNCIETRPDAINKDWLEYFRKWGVTRIQIGVQHTNNKVLKKINRGHTIECAVQCMQYLKDNCFKIDIHIMPDLPGSNPAMDIDMFKYVYSVVCPDQMKVYPCQTVPWTKIEKWYNEGSYVPYFDKNPQDLINVVKYSMETCPKWVRLPRVIRDIPCSTYVEGGNNIANMRQVIDKLLDGEGIVSYDIRAREIGRNSSYYKKPADYNIYKYSANNGTEYFICYESYDKKALFGFIRLRIVNKKENMTEFNVLKGKGLVRELHVYGETTAVNSYKDDAAQHRGIGGNLLKLSEKITKQHNLYGIAVIAGDGVRGYYEEKHGYKDEETFMVKYFRFWEVWLVLLVYYFKYLFKFITIYKLKHV